MRLNSLGFALVHANRNLRFARVDFPLLTLTRWITAFVVSLTHDRALRASWRECRRQVGYLYASFS
jgi:hypothetical protein